ncbi:MAG: DUF1837 domain-containing protein, partial [Campylobacterales bacterium]|nr:DUF1837 domain-containing protein [Campylobacterales bacterium]
YKGICFVGFDSTNYPEKPMQKTVDELRIAFASEFDNWFKNITSRIGKYANLELYEIHFFLIPFPSVENFRKHFLETLKK